MSNYNVITIGKLDMIKLGDNVVEFAPEFKLYFTTKLPNPHYAPEICVAACLLNFVATAEGLTWHCKCTGMKFSGKLWEIHFIREI